MHRGRVDDLLLPLRATSSCHRCRSRLVGGTVRSSQDAKTTYLNMPTAVNSNSARASPSHGENRGSRSPRERQYFQHLSNQPVCECPGSVPATIRAPFFCFAKIFLWKHLRLIATKMSCARGRFSLLHRALRRATIERDVLGVCFRG